MARGSNDTAQDTTQDIPFQEQAEPLSLRNLAHQQRGSGEVAPCAADRFERGQNEALGTMGLLTKLPPQGKSLQRSQPFTVYLNPDNPEVRACSQRPMRARVCACVRVRARAPGDF